MGLDKKKKRAKGETEKKSEAGLAQLKRNVKQVWWLHLPVRQLSDGGADFTRLACYFQQSWQSEMFPPICSTAIARKLRPHIIHDWINELVKLNQKLKSHTGPPLFIHRLFTFLGCKAKRHRLEKWSRFLKTIRSPLELSRMEKTWILLIFHKNLNVQLYHLQLHKLYCIC